MIDFQKSGGLVPAIAQDHQTGEVLMMAWMNQEAFEETVRTGKAVYFSRSRNKLWRKGEESGHVQEVKGIYVDCDADTVLLKVDQIGGAACHEGYKSCFFRQVQGDELEGRREARVRSEGGVQEISHVAAGIWPAVAYSPVQAGIPDAILGRQDCLPTTVPTMSQVLRLGPPGRQSARSDGGAIPQGRATRSPTPAAAITRPSTIRRSTARSSAPRRCRATCRTARSIAG